MWHKVFNILTWCLITAYLGVGLAFTEKHLDQQVFKAINIKVVDSTEVHFVTADDIMKILTDQGIRINGTRVTDLNRNHVRQTILSFPGVYDATVYSTPEGILNIDVSQRKPVVRLINPDQSWYVDAMGVRIPLSSKYSPRVLLVTGSATDGFLRDSISPLAGFISRDPVLDTLIQGLQVYPDHTIEIMTRNSGSRIFFGDPSDYEWKLRKLKIFYNKCVPVVGWDDYARIDLRYSNQIVAKKWSEPEMIIRDSLRMSRDSTGTILAEPEKGQLKKSNKQARTVIPKK